MKKTKIISDLLKFFIDSRRWWLIPVIIYLIILGLFFTFVESSVLAPFIYTLF